MQLVPLVGSALEQLHAWQPATVALGVVQGAQRPQGQRRTPEGREALVAGKALRAEGWAQPEPARNPSPRLESLPYTQNGRAPPVVGVGGTHLQEWQQRVVPHAGRAGLPSRVQVPGEETRAAGARLREELDAPRALARVLS